MSDLESIIYANTMCLETSRSPIAKKAAKKLLDERKSDRQKRDERAKREADEKYQRQLESFKNSTFFINSIASIKRGGMGRAQAEIILENSFKEGYRP